MVITIGSTEYRECYDEVLDDGVNKLLNYYVDWKAERDKIEANPKRFDAGAEELMRENLISKVIGVQQLFEKPRAPFRVFWSDRRLKAIKNMGQIQSILKSMKAPVKKKKKKKKPPPPVMQPLISEKPKPLPDGFANFSKLLPKVDMRTMETRSFRWSMAREMDLVDKYLESEHMKHQAAFEARTGIKPILKIDFMQTLPLPLTATWTKLPISKNDIDDDDGDDFHKRHSDGHEGAVPKSRMGSRAPSRLSVHRSRKVSVVNNMFDANAGSDPAVDERRRRRSNRLSVVSKNSLTVPPVSINVIDEESVTGAHSDTDSTVSPQRSPRKTSFPIGYDTSLSQQVSLRLQTGSTIRESESKDHMRAGLGEPSIDTSRYYRSLWTRKKFKRKLQFDVSDEEEVGEDSLFVPTSPPAKCKGVDIHQGFMLYGEEGGHTEREIEQIRRRRLEELFLDVKLFRRHRDDQEKHMGPTKKLSVGLR